MHLYQINFWRTCKFKFWQGRKEFPKFQHFNFKIPLEWKLCSLFNATNHFKNKSFHLMFWVKEKVDGSIFPPFVAILCRMRHFFEIKICRIILLSLPFNATRSNLMPLILVETTNSVPWQLLILAFLKYFEFRVNYFNWNRIMEANHIFKHRQALIRVHRDTWKWSFSWKSRSSGFTTYTFLETKKFITLFLDYHQAHCLVVLLI